MTSLRKKNEPRQKDSLLKWLFYTFKLSEITESCALELLVHYNPFFNTKALSEHKLREPI